jgi:hypothetical protein
MCPAARLFAPAPPLLDAAGAEALAECLRALAACLYALTALLITYALSVAITTALNVQRHRQWARSLEHALQPLQKGVEATSAVAQRMVRALHRVLDSLAPGVSAEDGAANVRPARVRRVPNSTRCEE